MKFIKFLILGVLFGIVLTKSEIISWFRIYEMFSFDAFHMYGIIGSAVIIGAIGIIFLKKLNIKSMYKTELNLKDKTFSVPRYLIGGILFGLGWALVGACPGPIFILIGHGYWSMVIVLVGAVIGTYMYGVLRSRLPH